MFRRHLARALTLGAVLFLSGIATAGVRHALAGIPAATSSVRPADPIDELYERIGLAGQIERNVFAAAFARMSQEGEPAGALAIADMSRPSTERRFVLVDLDAEQLLLQTWVAHGSGSGDLMARRFSNRSNSRQTSLGLFRVGARYISPKSGASLLLEGLDPGLNDRARSRELVIHGADYVSEDFIAQVGRLGRSWGCPAIPREHMATVVSAFANGGYLYIHGG